MGLCVAVQDEAGNRIGNLFADDRNLLDKLIGHPDWHDSPLLASIDRYGDTTFNRQQLRHFSEEWASLKSRIKTDEEASLHAIISHLVEVAAQDVHRYLVFIGD